MRAITRIINYCVGRMPAVVVLLKRLVDGQRGSVIVLYKRQRSAAQIQIVIPDMVLCAVGL